MTNSTLKRKLKLTVNGKAYTVEVGSLAESPINVMVNGQPYLVEISTGEVTRVSSGESAAALEGAVRTVSAVPQSAPLPASGNAITAPMPGQIVDVHVKSGDQVNSGQEVCSLEAMKMTNAIRSPQAGVVASVEVTAGQKVAHGEVLIKFE